MCGSESAVRCCEVEVGHVVSGSVQLRDVEGVRNFQNPFEVLRWLDADGHTVVDDCFLRSDLLV